MPQHRRAQKRLAACLALIAGYVDAYGLIVLGTYVSLMSGNTTSAGVKAGEAHFAGAHTAVIAIVLFVAGSFAGATIAHSRPDHAHRILFGLVAALLALAFAVGGSGALNDMCVALLAFAMGIMNQSMSRLGAEAVNLTFVTGALSKIGVHLALARKRAPVPNQEGAWDTHRYRARIHAQLWAAYTIGAILAGAALSFARNVALAPVIVVLAAFAWRSPVRQATE